MSGEEYHFTLDAEHQSFEYRIENQPTGVRVSKINERGEPLAGAGFAVKKAGFLQSILPFTKADEGVYRYDPNGKETTLMTDENGKLLILELPNAEYWLEEAIIPEGYFPAAPTAFTVTEKDTYKTPLEIAIQNSPWVKLGLDTDKYNRLIAALLIGIGAGIPILMIIRHRKKQREDKEA